MKNVLIDFLLDLNDIGLINNYEFDYEEVAGNFTDEYFKREGSDEVNELQQEIEDINSKIEAIEDYRGGKEYFEQDFEHQNLLRIQVQAYKTLKLCLEVRLEDADINSSSKIDTDTL